MRILVVDDDPIARAITSTVLRKCGHEVFEAADGEIGLSMIADQDIRCVVSDWVMPKLAGIDMCRQIRASNLPHYVYVILCTSRDTKADLVEGMYAGADDFVVKPINPSELRVKVRAGVRILDLEQGLAERNRELAGINVKLQYAQKRLEDDLKAAAWIQEQLLPSPALTAHGVKCEWRFLPSGYIAGDIFNFFALDNTHVGFYLLDVSGHGVPAAMMSVTLSMTLTPDSQNESPLKDYDFATGALRPVTPEAAILNLNRRFQFKDDRYFTMVYGVLDTESSRLSLAQAGHPSPIFMKPGESPQLLGNGGMPVGLWPEMDFDCLNFEVSPGDRLLLYSDGVTECTNRSGELFGERRLLDYLERSSPEPLDVLLEGLVHEMKEWSGGLRCEDDVSLLTIEFAGDACKRGE
jgi:sigma-B regulation protein RsbU (phosphoserine phosphatase)